MLGVDRFDYKSTERRTIVPKSRVAKDRVKLEEERRLVEFAARKWLDVFPSSPARYLLHDQWFCGWILL